MTSENVWDGKTEGKAGPFQSVDSDPVSDQLKLRSTLDATLSQTVQCVFCVSRVTGKTSFTNITRARVHGYVC